MSIAAQERAASLAAERLRRDPRLSAARRLADAGKLLDAESVFDDFSRALRGFIIVEEELFGLYRAQHRSVEVAILRARTALMRGNAVAFDAAAAELALLLEQA